MISNRICFTLGVLFGLMSSAHGQTFTTLNEGLTGSWFNQDMAGQGFLVEVDAGLEFIFIAWFTYESALSTAKLGDPQHRWLTAQGNYSGTRVELPLFSTSGGVFDTATDTMTDQVGTLVVEFTSCTAGSVDYDLPDDALSGRIDLERLTPDVLCQEIVDNTPPPTPPATVKLTYIGNAGVFIDDGTDGVLIDAIGAFTGWVSIPATISSAIQNATPPYDLTRAIAVSHSHGDHFGPASISNVLVNHPSAQLFVTTQGRGSFAGSSQLVDTSPARFENSSHAAGDMTVTVVNTRHFNQFGNDFSTVENYAYLVDIAGVRVLHTGDIDYAANNFSTIAAIPGGLPDVIVMPTFNTLISATNRDLIRQFFPDAQIIANHFQVSQLNLERNQVLNLFPGAVIFDQPGEVFETQASAQ